MTMEKKQEKYNDAGKRRRYYKKTDIEKSQFINS